MRLGVAAVAPPLTNERKAIMARIKSKLLSQVTVEPGADKLTAAAVVARAMGDNAKVKASDMEPVIFRANTARAELLDMLRRAPHDQAEFQTRCFIAEAYARDWRKNNADKPIPPLTDKVRATWAKVFTQALKACTKEERQLRATLRTWWTRLLFDAGVKTMATRGGAHGNRHTVTKVTKDDKPIAAKGAETTAKPSVAAVVAAVPRVTSPLEAVNFLQKEAAIMLRFVNHNIDPVMKGKPSPTDGAIAKLVAKFVRDLAAIGTKLDKAKA